MDFSAAQILENTLYFLALINPASKILFLSAYDPPLNFRQIFELSWKSSLAALLMLVLFSLCGQVILRDIFRIEIYSLRISGGLILFFTGWIAVREGRFFQHKEKESLLSDFTEISIIPLAAPLITGPGTITITLTLATEYGQTYTLLIMFLAILTNFLLMISALPINRMLLRIHMAGPLIRITGLIVATVAIQMILTGTAEWLKLLFP
ncbi:MAG: MarC family protein [Lentisphaeria bacterium]